MFIVCGIERYTNILKCPPPHTAEFISSLLRLLISCQLLQNFSGADGYLGQQAWLLGWRPGCPQTLTGPRYPRRNSRCSTHVYRHVYTHVATVTCSGSSNNSTTSGNSSGCGRSSYCSVMCLHRSHVSTRVYTAGHVYLQWGHVCPCRDARPRTQQLPARTTRLGQLEIPTTNIFLDFMCEWIFFLFYN